MLNRVTENHIYWLFLLVLFFVFGNRNVYGQADSDSLQVTPPDTTQIESDSLRVNPPDTTTSPIPENLQQGQ